MNIYQQQILDNYHNPHNFGKPDSYDLEYAVENISCGDAITIYLQVADQTVTTAHFDGEGCAISIAAGSILTQYLPGKTLAEVDKLTTKTMIDLLGIELTTSRQRCATLALEAVQSAAQTYEQKK